MLDPDMYADNTIPLADDPYGEAYLEAYGINIPRGGAQAINAINKARWGKQAVYWQEQEEARKAVAAALRKHLVKKFLGRPVVEVRGRLDEFQDENKAVVAETLAKFGIHLTVSWRLAIDHFVKDGQPIVCDFTVTVE